ncbi:MAG: Adenylate cyclase, partial [uncultured Thermomicrobiales bacterium]
AGTGAAPAAAVAAAGGGGSGAPRDLVRALLRPGLRGCRRPAGARAGGRHLGAGFPPLRAALRAGLVGLGALHLLRRPVRQRRRRLPPARHGRDAGDRGDGGGHSGSDDRRAWGGGRRRVRPRLPGGARGLRPALPAGQPLRPDRPPSGPDPRDQLRRGGGALATRAAAPHAGALRPLVPGAGDRDPRHAARRLAHPGAGAAQPPPPPGAVRPLHDHRPRRVGGGRRRGAGRRRLGASLGRRRGRRVRPCLLRLVAQLRLCRRLGAAPPLPDPAGLRLRPLPDRRRPDRRRRRLPAGDRARHRRPPHGRRPLGAVRRPCPLPGRDRGHQPGRVRRPPAAAPALRPDRDDHRDRPQPGGLWRTATAGSPRRCPGPRLRRHGGSQDRPRPPVLGRRAGLRPCRAATHRRDLHRRVGGGM